MEGGGRVLFLDSENALNDDQLDRLGVTKYKNSILEDGEPQFIHLCPVTFDEVDEILQKVLQADVKLDLIVLDSITMLTPDRPEGTEKKISAEEAGHGARVQARFLRLYKGLLARSGVAMVILNQMRTNLKGWVAYVKPAGGKALEFVPDIRMGIAVVKPGDGARGKKEKEYPIHLAACTIKNKHAVPFKPVPLLFTPGLGVDDAASIAELLISRELIKGAGGYYSLPGIESKCRRSDVRDWVDNNYEEALRMLSDLMT